MKLGAPLLPAFLLGIGMMFPAAPASAQTGPERLLPEGTLVYMGSSDLDQFINTVKTKPMGRILREEEMQDFLEKPLSMLRGHLTQLTEMAKSYEPMKDIEVDVEKLLKGPYGACFFAFTHLTFPQNKDGEPDVGLIVGIEPKPGAVDVLALLQQAVFAIAASEGEELEQKQVSVGDLSFSTLRRPDGDGPPMCFTKIGGMSILSLSEVSMREILLRASGGVQGSLATSTGFARGVAHAGQSTGGSPLIYFDAGGMVEMGLTGLRFAEKMMEQEGIEGEERSIAKAILRGLEMSEFHKVGSMYGTTSWEGDVAVSRTFTSYDRTAGGLLGEFGKWAQPINRDLLKIVPKDATSFSTMHFKLDGVYDEIMRIMGEVAPEVKTMVDGAIGDFEKQIAGADDSGNALWNIRKDFLGAVGGEFMMMSSPGAPTMFGPGSDSVGWWACADPAGMQKSLEFIAAIPGQLAGFPVKFNVEDHSGVKMHVLDPMSLGPMAMMVGAMKPTYAIHDGRFYFGTSPGALKKTIDGLKSPPEENIMQKEDFSRHFKHVAEDSVLTSLSYADTKQNFEAMYQQILGVLPMVMMGMPIDQNDLPFEMSLLPTAEAISQHLFGTMSYSEDLEDGELIVSRGPMGSEVAFVVLGGAAAVGMSVGFSEIEKQQEITQATHAEEIATDMDPASKAREDLQQIESWLTIYIVYNSTSPVNLGELSKSSERFPEGINQGTSVPATDPWGHAYSYNKKGDGYVLWSWGPDGINDSGSGDDPVIRRE